MITELEMISTTSCQFEIDDLSQRIAAIRLRWGKRLLILGHYYQKPEILANSDFRGDSFQLSAEAAQNTEGEAIVFCGVHFMAETADILANAPERVAARGGKRIPVLLPDSMAGCPMADMATLDEVTEAWESLGSVIDLDDVTPITYVNSSAAIKAFCGARGGLACTSSNARAVLDWSFRQKSRVLFLPDENLGRNTALAMGVTAEKLAVYHVANPKLLGELALLEADGLIPDGSAERERQATRGGLGGNSPEAIRESRVILWRGFCPVHQRFTIDDVRRVKTASPEAKIVVHPECRHEVVAASDEAGSTKRILDLVRESPSGSNWAVGTERRMVDALAADFPDRTILPLADEKPRCDTMDRITLKNLLRTLESLDADRPENVVTVPDAVASDARSALTRMLACR